VQLRLSGGAFDTLPQSQLDGPDPTGGRSADGKWSAIIGQDLLAAYPPGQHVMQKLAEAGMPHDLTLEQGGGGLLKLTVASAGVSGALADKGGGYYQGELLADGAKADATARLFDGGRLLLLYLGQGPYLQLAYRRAEQAAPWETPAAPPPTTAPGP
jgi:hypothetical protein